MGKKVCMIVFNHFKNDSRVLKEAYTLIENGYTVKVFALLGKDVSQFENREGLEIERVQIDPIHLRVFSKKERSYSPQKNTSQKDIAESKKEQTPQITNSSHPKKGFKSTQLYIKLYAIFKWVFLSVHKPLTYYDFHRRVSPKIIKEKYDIVHAHDLNTLYPAYFTAKRLKAKLIYDSHELYIHRNKPKSPSKLYKFITGQFEKYLIRKTDAVITVGDCIAQHLKDTYKVPLPAVIMNAPSKIVSPIDQSKNLRSELNISDDLKLAIYCGGITFNRGLEKLIESMKLLPDVYLVLMGYGDKNYLKSLEKIAISSGIEDRFSFYGPVAPTEVTAYTASADLGVAPIKNVCLSYYYCAPNKIFEYIIGGIPVVASDFPELSKIVSESKIGYTFDPEDIHSISSSIQKIFADSSTYQDMKNNTKVAAERYNWENEAKKLLTLYSQIEA